MCYNTIMNNFYEYFRDKENELYYKIDNNPVYPPHFHAGIEVFILKKGFFTLTINGAQINLTAGSIAVVDSYEIHSYDFKAKLEENSAALLIPYEFRRFLVPSDKHKIDRHVITNGTLSAKLISLIEEYIVNKPKQVKDGAIVLICSLLKEHLAFSTENEKDDVDLLKKILSFIYENYQGDVSRQTIAKTLGYTEGYISHVFHRYLNVSISSFSNVLRLKHVDDMIKNGDNRPISALLYQAGFKSEQTYYRVKAKLKN